LISAHNQNNLAPPKLTLANLRLYQSGKQLQIVYLQPQPVTVGILVENSGSMEPKLPQTRAALADFIRGLNPGDEIFVDAFSDRPFTLAELSTDHKVAIDHLGMMRAYGRTALYDVIIQGLQTVSQGCNQRKALVVLTDGMDTASSSSLDQVTKDAQSVKVPICSIGIGDPTASSSGGRSFYFGPPSLSGGRSFIPTPILLSGTNDEERVDTQTLHKLSARTAGETFFVAIGSQENSLKQTTTDVARKIGNQYTVGFVGDGTISQLQFGVTNQNGVSLKIDMH